ncbi:MAG: hypothetical protein K5864_05860 [Bacteroidales bacterium]|nr:hypothetical protein [Bacteroidales bacterium]
MTIKQPALLLLFVASMLGGVAHAAAAPPDSTFVLQGESPATLHMLQEPPLTLSGEPDGGAHHLYFDLDASGYFFDSEYTLPFAKSISVVGTRLAPSLLYGINDRALLRVGMTASYFAGSDSLHGVRPMVSLVYEPLDWLRLAVGTLEGSSYHKLPAPLYNPDNWIYDYSENGMQITTTTRRWQSDTWLNWRHYLELGRLEQEYFTFGGRHEVLLLNSLDDEEMMGSGRFVGTAMRDAGWRLTLPAVFMANHRGGVTSTLDTNAQTSFNESVALRLQYGDAQRVDHVYSSHRLTVEPALFIHHFSDVPVDSVGYGFWPTMSYEWKHLDYHAGRGFSARATVGYWYGTQLYHSVLSSPQFEKNKWYDESRNMLTVALELEHEYRHLNVGALFKLYYDFKEQRSDAIFAFYIRFKDRWRLL